MTTTVPKTMQAYVMPQVGKGEVQEVAVPTPAADEILVKVAYVALNPTDWKHRDMVGNAGSIIGCDFSGIVAEAGADTAGWKAGDRVAGFVHGGKYPDKGSMAQYLVVKGNLAFHVPDSRPLDEACTFGVGFSTAAMTLFNSQGAAYPPAKVDGEKWFLVSGGSTSVGLYLIPLLVLAGYKVVATASPRSFELVKKYGANAVVDYHDVDAAVAEIKKVSGGGVTGALEAVGGDNNYRLSVNSFGPAGGILTTINPPVPESAQKLRSDVTFSSVLLYTVGGYSFELIPGVLTLPAVPKDNAWAIDLAKRAPDYLGEKYNIPSNPLDVRSGLDHINEGLDELKSGKVSAKKLVYKVADV